MSEAAIALIVKPCDEFTTQFLTCPTKCFFPSGLSISSSAFKPTMPPKFVSLLIVILPPTLTWTFSIVPLLTATIPPIVEALSVEMPINVILIFKLEIFPSKIENKPYKLVAEAPVPILILPFPTVTFKLKLNSLADVVNLPDNEPVKGATVVPSKPIGFSNTPAGIVILFPST